MAGIKSMTPAQAEEYMDAFRLFDKNKDGKLDINELGKVLRIIGQNPTEADIKKTVADADKEGKGYLTEQEYIQMIKEHTVDRQELELQLREAFRIFDRDRTGFLDLNQMMKAVRNLGEPMMEDEVQELMQMADVNEDGKVDVEEFVRVMCRTL